MSGSAWMRVASVLGCFAVALGAFGAHVLKEKLEALHTTAIYHTAVQYHFYHVFALLAVGLLSLHGRSGATLSIAGWCFTVGILVFSGSLYTLAFTGMKWLGMITPLGGLAMIAGWIALAIAAGSRSSAG